MNDIECFASTVFHRLLQSMYILSKHRIRGENVFESLQLVQVLALFLVKLEKKLNRALLVAGAWVPRQGTNSDPISNKK